MNTSLRLIVAFAAIAFLCDETRAFPFGQGPVSESLKKGDPNGVTFAVGAFGDSLIRLFEKELKLIRFILTAFIGDFFRVLLSMVYSKCHRPSIG